VTNDSTTTTHGWLNNEDHSHNKTNKETNHNRAGAGSEGPGLSPLD